MPKPERLESGTAPEDSSELREARTSNSPEMEKLPSEPETFVDPRLKALRNKLRNPIIDVLLQAQRQGGLDPDKGEVSSLRFPVRDEQLLRLLVSNGYIPEEAIETREVDLCGAVAGILMANDATRPYLLDDPALAKTVIEVEAPAYALTLRDFFL